MNLLDTIPLSLIFIVGVLLQILFIEIGYHYGIYRQSQPKPNKSQMAQVRAIMGASLGLLAFMLAFNFSTAQQHQEERTGAYMLEVSAIDSAYRGADLIDEANQESAKQLLREFTRLRLATSKAVQKADLDTVLEQIRHSEEIHDALWKIAEQSMERGRGTGESGLFAQSVLDLINAHDMRLQTAFFNRISPVIWLTLFLMALLSMVVMGYQAGLTGTRSKLATWAIALTFVAVIVLIADLDRPNRTLFQLNEQLMIELENRMEGHQGLLELGPSKQTGK